MAVIGTIDIAMRASTEKFTAGLKTASASLASFTKNAASSGIDKFGGAASAAGGHVSGLASSLTGLGGISSLVGGAFAALGGASLGALTAGSLAAIDATGDLADRLGVTGGALAGFQYAVKLTGGPVEALPEILGKLNGTLGKAAIEGGTAGDAISKLGLDARALANAGPIEATKAIADGLGKIGNPAERAAAAVGIFGEQGAKLAGTFAAGSAGIAQLEAEAVKLGISLKATDYAKVAAANDALDRSAAAFAGIGNSLAVSLSPYIEAAAAKFTEFATAGGGFGPMIASGIKTAVSAVGFFADSIQFAEQALKLVGASAASVWAGILEGIAAADRGIQAFINSIPGVEVPFDSALTNMATSARAFADDQKDSLNAALLAPPPSAGWKSFFDGIESSANASAEAVAEVPKTIGAVGAAMADAGKMVADLESKLKDQIATFGLSSDGIEYYKLQQAGASTADLGRIASLGKQLEALKASQKAQEAFAKDAAKVFEDSMNPLQKLQAESAKLQDLFAGGFIDQATLDRGLNKAAKDGGFVADPTKRAGAIAKGSQEARSSILAFRQGNGGNDVGKKTEANTAATAKSGADQVSILRTIAAKLGDAPQIVSI